MVIIPPLVTRHFVLLISMHDALHHTADILSSSLDA